MSAALLKRASHLLRHPEETGLPVLVEDQTSALRIVHEPACTRHRSWSVYRPRDPAAPLALLRLTWNPADDHVPGWTQPTLVHALAYAPPSRVEPLTTELRSITMAIGGSERVLGLDGEFWSVELGDGWLGARFTWWCDGPPAWKPLVDWTRRAAEFLESIFGA